jgi:CheY-like chemotaxis protein
MPDAFEQRRDASSEKETPVPTQHGATETILVVEDDVLARTETRALLERNGYRVLEAANGVEVLALWDDHRRGIALILTGLIMPGGIDGQEFARRLKWDHDTLKIIYASGQRADAGGRVLELHDGESIVPKPCPPDDLLETVRSCLDGRFGI